MKSKEFRIGLLVLAALAIFILGFNFLKGNNTFSKDKTFYTFLNSSGGIDQSSQVLLLDIPVGKVENIELIENNTKLKVTFSVINAVDITDGSKLRILSPGPLGGDSNFALDLAQNSTTLKAQAFVPAENNVPLMDKAEAIVDSLPVTMTRLNTAIERLDSVAIGVNNLVSGNNGKNLESAISNMRVTMVNLNKASKNANILIEGQTERIDGITGNLKRITTNFAEYEDDFNLIVANLKTTSNNLAVLELQKTLNKVDGAVNQLNSFLTEVNTGQGTLGKLIYDDKLYDNLNDAANDMDKLVLDLRNNPKRYLPNISLIGGGNKKDKNKKNEEEE